MREVEKRTFDERPVEPSDEKGQLSRLLSGGLARAGIIQLMLLAGQRRIDLTPLSESLIPPTDAHIRAEPDGARNTLDRQACTIDPGSAGCVDEQRVVTAREHGPERQQAPDLASENPLATAQPLKHVRDAIRHIERRSQTPVLIELRRALVPHPGRKNHNTRRGRARRIRPILG